MKTLEEIKWTSVNERLPGENRKSNWALVYMRGVVPGIQAAVYNRNMRWKCDGEDITDLVTHWMPLLEPPKP